MLKQFSLTSGDMKSGLTCDEPESCDPTLMTSDLRSAEQFIQLKTSPVTTNHQERSEKRGFKKVSSWSVILSVLLCNKESDYKAERFMSEGLC